MQMMLLPHLFLLLVLLPSLQPSSSSPSEIINYCDPNSQPDPLTLRSDKLTVLISGYSPHRIPLLRSLALSYVSHPSVLSVLILWSNPSTPYSLLAPLLSLSYPPSKKVNLLNSSASLSSRFLPRHILTRSVLITDDDVLLPSRALSLALRLSSIGHHPLLGFFARSHLFDLDSKSWIYTAPSATRYSIVLTKAMLLHSRYLYAYSCDDRFRLARRYVDEARNCEDILMNFVVAMETREGPVLVEAEGGVRDWGDPRNDDDDDDKGGLSVRKEHMKRRGECIGEFHRLIGEMPLRYRYGKVVDGVGEQGVCNKAGKLVYCDQQT